jgi:hypothetical protein
MVHFCFSGYCCVWRDPFELLSVCSVGLVGCQLNWHGLCARHVTRLGHLLEDLQTLGTGGHSHLCCLVFDLSLKGEALGPIASAFGLDHNRVFGSLDRGLAQAFGLQEVLRVGGSVKQVSAGFLVEKGPQLNATIGSHA